MMSANIATQNICDDARKSGGNVHISNLLSPILLPQSGDGYSACYVGNVIGTLVDTRGGAGEMKKKSH